MPQLKFRTSYSAPKFNTVDGDLSKGQYARHPVSGYYVRRHAQNNYQFLHVDAIDPSIDVEEVTIIPDELAYYYEFYLPGDNRLLRVPVTKRSYESLRIKGATKPQKSLSEQNIAKERLKENEWLDVNIEMTPRVRKQLGDFIHTVR